MTIDTEQTRNDRAAGAFVACVALMFVICLLLYPLLLWLLPVTAPRLLHISVLLAPVAACGLISYCFARMTSVTGAPIGLYLAATLVVPIVALCMVQWVAVLLQAMGRL